jgi:CubicO group peptidase (beta-lactamase class C family)
MRLRFLASLFLLSLFSALAPASASSHAPDQSAADACAVLAKPMRDQHVAGAAIAVFRYGQPTLNYCGVADVSTQRPVSADTVFEAASLGKPVFAYAVLELVRERKLDLDKPLADYLGSPYVHQQRPFNAIDPAAKDSPTDIVNDPRFAKITARMVLSHTSGLPNWARGPLKLQSDPGKKWAYSGEGYVYLQRAVEALTHLPLEEVVRQNVFLPLQMNHSTFVPSAVSTSALATGYDRSGRPVRWVPSQPLAPSTLFTTAKDYAKFLESLLVLPIQDSPFGMEEQPQAVASAANHVTWGLGVGLEAVHDQRSIFHMGANPGFQGFFLLTPDTGEGVLLLTNSENGLALVPLILARWSHGKHPLLALPQLHPAD